MGCVLYVSGTKLLVDDLLGMIPLSASAIWHTGEPRLAPKTRPLPDHQDSGFKVIVSDMKMQDLPGQIEDAIKFLRARTSALDILANYPGVEELCLDFGVTWREGRPMISIDLPFELISEASKFHLGLTVTLYQTSE